MCGIVGYVGKKPAQEVLLTSLSQLEYRGYDSSGIALHQGSRIERTRAVGNLEALRMKIGSQVLATGSEAYQLREETSSLGIGHTRWATHGGVTEANAHPHADNNEEVHIVMNGIIE